MLSEADQITKKLPNIFLKIPKDGKAIAFSIKISPKHKSPGRALPGLLCLDAAFVGSALEVADVLFLAGIEEQVADGGNQGVDTAGDIAKEQVSLGSAGVALRLQGGVVDDQAADLTQEKGQQETDEIVVIHCQDLL
ncbi:MAG: hypothetical protein J6L87_04475 [Clostridia bacterium]|nr:hypothetical protein [Clostridia bacterium]